MKNFSILFSVIAIVLLSPTIFVYGATQTFTAESFRALKPTQTIKQPVATSNFSLSVKPDLKKSAGLVSNQVNLQKFLDKIRESGKNDPQIEKVIEQIKIDVATTTDLMGLFLKQAKMVSTKGKIGSHNPLKEKITSFFSLLKPKEAVAVATLPFGGPIIFAYQCPCSPFWLIYVGPTSNLATSDMLLDYTAGSQGFLNYNIPLTTNILGRYVPGTSMCLIYVGVTCSYVPGVYGKISPLVGSSEI